MQSQQDGQGAIVDPEEVQLEEPNDTIDLNQDPSRQLYSEAKLRQPEERKAARQADTVLRQKPRQASHKGANTRASLPVHIVSPHAARVDNTLAFRGLLSRSQAPMSTEPAFKQPLSPGSSEAALNWQNQNGVALPHGLRSNFGSNVMLAANQTSQQSNLNRHSTMRFTMKVNQIDPPESDEDHFSLDSKTQSPNKHLRKKQGKAAAQAQRRLNQRQIGLAKQVDGPPHSPPFKVQKRGDTPESGRNSDHNMQFAEQPLEEEPMPEQRSFVKQQPSGGKKIQARDGAALTAATAKKSQIENFSKCTDSLYKPHEAMKQPSEHEDPPFAAAGYTPSVRSEKQLKLNLQSIHKPTQQDRTPSKPEEFQPYQEQANLEAINALKIQTAAIDPVHNVGIPTSQQDEDGADGDQYSDSEDAQFPQDVLFTNANEQSKGMPQDRDAATLRSRGVALIPTQNPIPTEQSPPARSILYRQTQTAKQYLHQEQQQQLYENVIVPRDTEHYLQLRTQLDDSNIYFLNPLKREVDNEDHFSRLQTDNRPDLVGDQTSFPGISVIMATNGQGQVLPTTKSIYDDMSEILREGRDDGSDLRQVMRQRSTPNVYGANNLPFKRNSGIKLETGPIIGHPQRETFDAPMQKGVSATPGLKHQKILQNQMSELIITKSFVQQRSKRDDSFMLEAPSIKEANIVDKSIAVVSADFDESKLLCTERRVLQQAELGKEQVYLMNGDWLQGQIDSAKPNETLMLESTTYKFTSLYINKPVTLMGQPETILEIDGGSIFVDFASEHGTDATPVRGAEDQEPVVPQTPFGGKLPSSIDLLKSHPLNRGTPLTIKKNKVARIQVCEIRFNRTKAALLLSKQAKREAPTGAVHAPEHHQFSQELSLVGATTTQNAAATNNFLGQPSQTMLQINSMSNNLGHESASQQRIPQSSQTQQGTASTSVISCFKVEHDSFIEVKDCCIKSISDKKNFDQEMDLYFRNRHRGAPPNVPTLMTQHQSRTTATNVNEKTDTNEQIQLEKGDFLEQMRRQDNEIRDYCFVLNHSPPDQSKSEQAQAYSGLVSLCSTTIQSFMFGVHCGPDAILTCETSSFIALRAGGCAIRSVNPKLLKFIHGSIQKCEANGIHVTLTEDMCHPTPQNHLSPFLTGKASPRPASPAGKDGFSDAAMFAPVRQQPAASHQQQQYEVLTTDPVDNEVDAFTASLQRLTRKIYIDNNRIVQVQGCPIAVEGPSVEAQDEFYLQYFVKVKDNRISNCGLESKLYVIPGASEHEKELEQELARQALQRIGGEPKACILLQNLHLFELSCFRNTISKGSGSGIAVYNVKAHKEDMSQVSALPTTDQEAALVFERCVGDEKRVSLVDNYVIEITQGYGMVVDSTTCFMELNQLKKNALGGLLVTSTLTEGRLRGWQHKQVDNAAGFETARYFGGVAATGQDISPVLFDSFSPVPNLPPYEKQNSTTKPTSLMSKQLSMSSTLTRPQQTALLKLAVIKQFRSVTIDNSTAVSNQKFGIGVVGFYGTVQIKNTHCHENETEGMLFAKSKNDPMLQNQEENPGADDAHILDFTERSSKPRGQRSRSPTINQPTDNAVIDQNQTSFCRQDANSWLEGAKPTPVEVADGLGANLLEQRPFEKHLGQAYLLKCSVQQNRQDGIKSVDYMVQSLGCAIQGNMASAIRLGSQEAGADCEVYLKSRQNEADLIGQILVGQAGVRYLPRMKIDANLPQLLKDLIKVQQMAIFLEMIQMNVQEPEKDHKASIIQKTNEEKLITMLQSQKSIIAERDIAATKLGAKPKKQGFFSFLNCCMRPKVTGVTPATAKMPARPATAGPSLETHTAQRKQQQQRQIQAKQIAKGTKRQ